MPIIPTTALVDRMDQARPPTAPPTLSRTDFGGAYSVGKTRTQGLLASRGVRLERASEIAHAAWCRAWERRFQLRSSAALQHWVNTIALNMLRDARRRDREEALVVEQANGSAPDRALDARITATRLLSQLSELDRRILVLSLVEGYSSKEVGTRLALSPGAVRVRLHRARARLIMLVARPEKTVPEVARQHVLPAGTGTLSSSLPPVPEHSQRQSNSGYRLSPDRQARTNSVS